MKKILALVLTVVMAASLAACGNSGTKETQAPASGDSETAAESTAAESTGETAEKVGEGVDVKDLKVGFIFIGDENEGYTAAHYAGAKGYYGVACAYATILIAIVYAAVLIMNLFIKFFGTSKKVKDAERQGD